MKFEHGDAQYYVSTSVNRHCKRCEDAIGHKFCATRQAFRNGRDVL